MYGSKQVEHSLAEGRQMLKSIQPDYWNVFDAVADPMELDKRELRRCENPKYLNYFLMTLYLDNVGEGDANTMRPTLTPELLKKLKTHEKLIIEEIEKHQPRVNSISTHISLKITVEDSYNSCWENRQPNTLCIVWDRMAILRIGKYGK